MLAINFIASSQVELIAALIIGYALAGFYIFSTAIRINNIIERQTKFSKMQTFIGLGLRLLMVFVVFAVSIKISMKVFLTMAIGFLTFYVFMQAGLIIHSYKSGYADDDKSDSDK